MKGHKGEGATQSQMKGALGAGERGPLFPRLHVNETEKPGPKAPPRNKMALYEQFTVPSHRFVPSQTSASIVYQQQYISHDLRYPYLRYYMPAVPYANTSHRGQVYALPSHGTSSSGVTNGSGVTNEDSSRKFPRHHKVGKSSPCKVSRGSTEASTDSSELKGKDANAPAQSSLSNLIEESTNSVHDVSPDTERPTITDIRESLQEALSTVEVEKCPMPGGQSCSHPRVSISVKSTCMTDEGQLQQAAQHSVDENLTKQTKGGALVESPGQSCLQTGSARAECKHQIVTQGMTSRTHFTTLSETSIEPTRFEESLTMIASNQSCPSSASRAVAGPGSALKGDETLSTYGHMNALKNSITDLEKADDSIGGLSVAVLAKPDDESSEELKNIQNRISKASQSLECGTHKGYHSDDSVMPSASFYSVPIIKPKNVIHAIGQQQFWKARKILLRQQQIFSDQVFQLHKLIMVQQLLAKTPRTLIDEEMQFETIKECNVAAPLAKGANNIGEDAHNVGLDVKKGSKDTSCEAGGQPRNKWEHIQAVGKVGIGSSKLMPEFHSSGISAWGYPSLGHWVGLLAAQGQPFGYQPFAGTLPPGSPFGLQYGSALQGSVSPMISLGIPYCDRRQELPAEMGSNYGPPAAFKHEESGTVSGNSSHVSNSLQGSWCNSLNQQRMHPAPPGEDVPSGSGVSVNKSSASVQVVNTSCGSGLSYQWDRTCQSGPSNTGSFKSYAHQSESSSPSIATRLNCQKSYFTPTTSVANMLGFSNTDVGRLAQNSDLGSAYGSCSSDQYDNNGQGAEEKEELNTSFLRCSKNQKDDVCLPVDDQVSDADERSSDINHSALELFPLVPFLSSVGQNRKKAAEEELGRVIRAVPRRAIAASESAAGILLSLQRERQK